MPKHSDSQTLIPFSIEGSVANRNMVRELSKNADYMRKVDISLIRIRPDRFNARIKPEGMSEDMWNHMLMIPDLADKIFYNCGPADAILGDFREDGLFYITNGERRFRGLTHLLATERTEYPDKSPVSEVIVILNPSGTTDLDRKKKMYTTNDNLPFTPMQKAHYFASFKVDPYNLTHEQIAEEFKVSRQTIDNYVLAATLPPDIQEKIDSGEIKISNALGEYRKEKSSKKKTEAGGNVDLLSPSQEYHKEEKEKEQEKLRGDEDEFMEQDNSVGFAGSKGGPSEDRSSGAHAIGKDSIYMQQQKEAIFKRFFNRYTVLFEGARQLVVADKPEDEVDEERSVILHQKRHDHAMNKLMMEYDITVK